MQQRWNRIAPALALFGWAATAAAQPQDLIVNGRPEVPSRYGVTAVSFDLNAGAVARGAVELQLQLPGGTTTILRRGAFQSRGNNSGLWRGKANLRNDSDVQLTLRNGYLAGVIQLGGDVYEIRPQANRHILEKLDMTSFPKCREPRAAGDAASGAATTTTVAAAGDAAVTIDLLSVYTPQARIASGGTAQVEALIQSAVDRANLAFANSLVNASYRLVHAVEVAHNDAGDLNTDLTWAAGDSGVAALRQTYGADMVSLIVENGAGYCGLGYVMRSVGSGFAPYAFQVTARSCAVGNLTLAHEHGHNLGMEHDPVNGTAPASASYPWSFGHYINGVYRTVMSYSTECPNGCSRVPYFSNPNVVYTGYAIGIPDQRDNARTANSTTPVVAAFRAEAPTTPPAPPSNLTATAISATQINLAWLDGSNNESGFRIERAADGVNFSLIATTGANVTSYSNTGLTGGTTYTYRVRAFNSVGSSDPAPDALATTPLPNPPLAPSGLTAAAVSASQINLAWLDGSNNESGFRVERSTDGVTFTLIATTGSNATSYSNTGLASNTSYTYRVRAYNGDGESANSNTATARTSQAAPAAPGGFAGTAQYSGSGKTKTLTAIALVWVDVANNTGYNIERCKQSGRGQSLSCTYAPLTNPGADAAAFTDTGVAATGKGTYQYRIRSFNASGSSAWVSTTVNAN